jgi:hypothetical protein
MQWVSKLKWDLELGEAFDGENAGDRGCAVTAADIDIPTGTGAVKVKAGIHHPPNKFNKKERKKIIQTVS